ncbi:hypothetical protein [Geomonas ferrireducens]|uniref:hypothetical protein n=1 Tax=Geomonas ferrireducens TaxID=2570227 RepID=UPI0010A8651A|nr:hypothetical protein [Geomonas ferrireducens]
MRMLQHSLLLAILFFSATPVLAGDIAALEKAIKNWAMEVPPPSYKHAFVDLNEDGTDDAVVLITDNQYCGSGGCSFLVFKGTSYGFQKISSSTITTAPILVLPEKKSGWHTLSVFVAGGGAKSGQVLMRFNGTKYPNNPSAQPKVRRNELKGAKTLISDK